jgi:hypothetical protein
MQRNPRRPRSSVVEREIPVFVVSSRPSVQSGSGSNFYFLYRHSGLLPCLVSFPCVHHLETGVGYPLRCSHSIPRFIFLRVWREHHVTSLSIHIQRVNFYYVLIHPASLSRKSADLTRRFKQNRNSLVPNSRATSKAFAIFAYRDTILVASALRGVKNMNFFLDHGRYSLTRSIAYILNR